jgi:hypothetical protein
VFVEVTLTDFTPANSTLRARCQVIFSVGHPFRTTPDSQGGQGLPAGPIELIEDLAIDC